VAALDGLRVLVVEDTLLVAEVITEILADSGCTVIGPVARVGRALYLLRETEIDGAVLDVNLAGQSSFPVAAELGAREIPYIFLTGYDDEAVMPPAYRTAPRLAKPFHAVELVAALAGRLDDRSPKGVPTESLG
jgi:DNA-binding response OmpR family regulator